MEENQQKPIKEKLTAWKIVEKILLWCFLFLWIYGMYYYFTNDSDYHSCYNPYYDVCDCDYGYCDTQE